MAHTASVAGRHFQQGKGYQDAGAVAGCGHQVWQMLWVPSVLVPLVLIVLVYSIGVLWQHP